MTRQQEFAVDPTTGESTNEADRVITIMFEGSDRQALRLTMEIALGKRAPVGVDPVLGAFARDPGKIRPVNHVWLTAELKAAGIFDATAKEFSETYRLAEYYLGHLETQRDSAVLDLWNEVFALSDFVPETDVSGIFEHDVLI